MSIFNIFKKKKNYTPLQQENFVERGFDLKIKIGDKVIYRSELVNTREFYHHLTGMMGFCFGDKVGVDYEVI